MFEIEDFKGVGKVKVVLYNFYGVMNQVFCDQDSFFLIMVGNMIEGLIFDVWVLLGFENVDVVSSCEVEFGNMGSWVVSKVGIFRGWWRWYVFECIDIGSCEQNWNGGVFVRYKMVYVVLFFCQFLFVVNLLMKDFYLSEMECDQVQGFCLVGKYNVG